MTSRQRILAALRGADMDRIPMLEIGFWPETLTRWRGEGMPGGDIYEYFGLDDMAFFTIDGSLRVPIRVEYEDDREIVSNDGNGLRMRQFKGVSAPPQVLSSPVRCPADWENWRGRLAAETSRLSEIDCEPITGRATGCVNQAEYYAKCRANDKFTVFTPIEPLWFYLRLLTEEEALIGIAEDPECVERMLADYTRFNIDMLKLLYERGMKFDAVWVFSDLCYKNGLLFSPRFYRERMQRHLKAYIDLCHEMGSKFIYHSDGNLSELIPLLFEAGIDCMQPIEARAGNDVRGLADQYRGTLSFMGNIDADKLSLTRDEIEEEVSSKVLAAKKYHRYLFHSDHSLPPLISLENYRFALEIARRHGKY